MNTDAIAFKVVKRSLSCGDGLFGVHLGVWDSETCDWKYDAHIMYGAIDIAGILLRTGIRVGATGLGIFRKSGKYQRVMEVLSCDC